MNIGKLLRKTPRTQKNSPHSDLAPKPKKRYELDIYFTANFHAKAAEWGLTEAHARHVFYEGDSVTGKENMKIALVKGEEIGIYVIRDRDTNQPVVTSIWKRQCRKLGRQEIRSSPLILPPPALGRRPSQSSKTVSAPAGRPLQPPSSGISRGQRVYAGSSPATRPFMAIPPVHGCSIRAGLGQWSAHP